MSDWEVLEAVVIRWTPRDALDDTADRNVALAALSRRREEEKRLREGRWTEEERKLFLFEATKASYAEGVRAGCEEVSQHAADMSLELDSLRKQLEAAAELAASVRAARRAVVTEEGLAILNPEQKG